MKRAVALAALGLAASACGTEGREPASVSNEAAPPPTASQPATPATHAVLGFTWTGGDAQAELVELDPLSLEPATRRRVVLGAFGPHAFSPDRSLVALGGGDVPEIMFIDVKRVEEDGDKVVLSGRNSFGTLYWATRRRLLALLEGGPEPRVVVVDPVARRVLGEQRLAGAVRAVRTTPDGLVLVLGPSDSIGPSRLAVVDARGEVRFAALSEIWSGWEQVDTDGDEHRTRQLVPGLAVDPTGRRAVVVPPGRRVAEIDLRTLAVSYHDLAEPISLLDRLHNWIEPPAHAKSPDGPAREAVWLGEHVVAVTGLRYETRRDGKTIEIPAGLDFIDTRDWTVRSLDPAVSEISLAHGALLAYGGSDGSWRGLTAYGPDGRRRFHVLGARRVTFVQVVGRYGYVVENETTTFVVDVRAGRLVRKTTTANPTAVVAEDF
jgi:hypothetical protein